MLNWKQRLSKPTPISNSDAIVAYKTPTGIAPKKQFEDYLNECAEKNQIIATEWIPLTAKDCEKMGYKYQLDSSTEEICEIVE